MNEIKKKFELLWKDSRSYKQRLTISGTMMFFICFTFLFFGPVEITAFSAKSLVFSVWSILPLMAIFAMFVFLASASLLALLRGRIFNYTITIIFALGIAAYLQGNALNGDLGTLAGEAIAWNIHKTSMFLNVLVWVVIVLLAFLLLYLNKQIWKKVVVAASGLIVVMQLVALITIFVNPEVRENSKETYFLSSEDMASYSKDQNVMVFLLDRLDYDYINWVLQDDPQFFDRLDGFTDYTNAISEHGRTKPGANYILTNYEKNMYEIPATQFLEQSWEDGDKHLLKDLKDSDYEIDVYSDCESMFGTGLTTKDYVSNMSAHKQELDKKEVIRSLVFLSSYRYMPFLAKPFFWCYTDDVNNTAYKVQKEEASIYALDETIYDNQMMDSVTNKKNNTFKFYHFNGPHAPYTLDQNGYRNEAGTDVVQQTKGSFEILMRAFSKMKEQGIYKDATIIITADHGDPVADNQALQKATRIGMFYKPSGVEGTPLKRSSAPVSLGNVPATIAKEAGMTYKQYGKPLDEITERSSNVRKFYKTISAQDFSREEKAFVYEIQGDAADFENWVKTDEIKIEYPFY